MAAVTPDLSVLYDKKKFKVITTAVEDEPNVIRCSRQRALGYYINALKEMLKVHDTIVIMGAGKAVATAEAVSDIALNIEAKLHKIVTKGTEKHSFTFESKDDTKNQITNEREVEYVRIKIVKDSKVTAAEKADAGYAAGPVEVSDESLAQAIRKARTDVNGPRRSSGVARPRGPRAPKAEGEAGEKKDGDKPRRARAPRKPRVEGEKKEGDATVDGDKKRAPRRSNRSRGPRKEGEKKEETA